MVIESAPRSIGLIGAGIMGEALLSALIASGRDPASITITEKREDRAAELGGRYGVKTASLEENVRSADALLLVVKPQDMAATLEEMKADIKSSTLVISFAAGKRIEFVNSILGANFGVIRVMPNTPTLVGEGMAAISVGDGVSAYQVAFVKDFLSATGQVVEVAEELQDAVTAVSGSGPAYFFAFVEAMVETGMKLGLSEEVATQLSTQTMAHGSALGTRT